MASIEDFLSGNKTYSSDYIRAYKNRYERLTKQQEEVRKQIEEAKKQEEEREAAYKKARTEYGADELNKRIEAEQEVWNGGTRVYNTKTNSYERPIVVLNDDNSIAYTNLDNIDRSKTVTSPMTGGVPYLSQALTGLANITSGGLIKNISDNDVKNKYAEQVSAKVNEIQANKDELVKNLGKERYNQLLQEANTYSKGTLAGYAQDKRIGELSVQRNRAWDQYYKDGTYVSRQKAEDLDRQLEEYQENNLGIGKQMFSTTVNQIPQFTYQIKKNVGGAVLSAAAYGLAKKLGAPDDLAKAVAAKTYGTSAVISGFGVTMEQTRGGEYGDLIRLGVPEDIARDAVQSSAVIQSIIEEAEEIVDIRNAFKVPQKDSVANGLKQVFKNWGVNIVTEGLQEGTQSVVGFVYEKDALNRAGMDVSDYTLESMMSQAWEEAKGGAEVGATMYIADGLPHIVVSTVTRARNQRLAIQDAPLISAQINIPTVEDDFGNVTVKSIEDAKKTIEEAYDEQVKMLEAQKNTATERDLPTIEKAIEITKEGKEKATTDKAVKALVDETNKVLDTQAVNKKQTLNKTTQEYADKVLGEEQSKAREKGFKDMTFKVADDITTGQKNVAKFAKSFAKLNIVYYDTENYRNGDSVYKHRGFWKDGDTIFVNSRIRTTKNVLSVVGHEYAHVYIDGVEGSREPGGLLDRMYTNEEAIAYGRNHGWRKQGFMPQQEIISYKEEMFADDVGEFLSNPVTVNNIEQGNKSVTASIKNTVANIVENSIGYRPQFDNVSQYNLEGQSVLGGVELNDDAKGRILQDINERSGNVSKKETTQEKATPKLSKKENTATRLTPEQKSNESWYKDQREDNKSRDAIQKSLALRMNKGVNSPEVKVELDRLEKKYNEANKTKRSKEIVDNQNQGNDNINKRSAKDGTSKNIKRELRTNENGRANNKRNIRPLQQRPQNGKSSSSYKLQRKKTDANLQRRIAGNDRLGRLNVRFTPKRLEGLLKWSGTLEPKFESEKSYGKIFLTRMSPQEYLNITASPAVLKQREGETLPFDEKKMREYGSSDGYSNPWSHIYLRLDMDTNEIFGQEGYHRMIAMRDAGIKNVDVVIWPAESSIDKDNISYIDEIDVVGINGKRGKLKALDPVTYNNYEHLKEKYLNTPNEEKTIRYSAEIDDGKKKNTRVEKWKGKAKKAEQETKTEKRIAKGRGRALRWSWKKEEQQRKQKETWKARTKKREIAIMGLRAKAKAKDTARKIGKLQDELLAKMRRFEKSETYKFMTDEQKKLYAETFGNIYRKAKSKTDKTRALEEAKAKIANELLSDPDIVVNDRIRKLALAPTQKTLSEFETVEQMTELIDAFEKVVEDTRKQQELVGLSKNTTSKEEKENFAATVKELKDKWNKKTTLREAKRNERSNTAVGRVQNALGTALNTTGRTLNKVYKNALSTIETQLLNMAGGNRNSKLMDIYDNLDRGVSRERGAYNRLNRILSSFLNDKKYAQLRKAIHPKNGWKDTGIVVKDIDGVEHKLYLNEGLMISLAMHYMQDQSLKHISGAKVDIAFDDDKNLVPITREGGGITIPNMELAKAGRTAEAISEGYIVKLSKKQLAEILDAHTDKDGNIQFGSLSNEANELVKTLKDEFFEQTYNYSDEVYYARHGYHLRRGDNYFPLVANKAYIYSHDKDKNLTASSTREAFGIEDNASFTKERNDNAFNPIVLENIGDVITRMIDGVSKYYGYEIALHNNRTLMNIKTNDINIEDALTKLDPSFKSNYRALEGFISGTMRHPKDLFSWARGKHAEFTLSLNPGSWVKQLLSVPTTAKYFTTKEMMEFVAGGEAALYETMKAYLESKGDYEKGSVLRNFVRYMTDDLDYRNLGFGLADMSDVMENKSVFQKLDIVKGVARFDMLGVNTVTRMFLFAELNRRGLLGDNLTRLSADEADAVFQSVGRDLEHFLRVTQPDYSQVNRANITRNSGVFARFATMYSTPALQMANNLMQSLSEFNYARSTGDKELMTKSGISLVKSAGGIVVASVGSVLISRAISQMFKGKDDEEDDFELGKEIAVSMLAPTLVLDDIARGLLGMQQYDSQVPELIAFDAVTSIASNINGLITGKEETKFNKVKNIIRDLGTLTGIPTRDLMKIARTVLMYSDSKLYYDVALRENTNAYKKWLDGNTTEDTRDFYKAYTATRDKVLESKYGYHKEDKANNIKSNKKESYRKALEDVLGKGSKKVDEYMTILGGYKS